MGRLIDPSTLEGDELFNWYRRSTADVEAEREAGRQARYDAFVRRIGAPSEPENDSAAEPQGGANDDGDVEAIKARFPLPAPTPVMPPPSGPMVGPPVDARAGPPIEAAKSGFFSTRQYVDAIGGYYNTDLPSPLNFVTQTPSGWWQLGDGSLAPTGEVERIYSEQQRRLNGQDDAPPPAPTSVVNKLKDGQVPRADQLAKGQRELDPTCAPNGGWERDPGFDNYPELSKRYETQITRAPGLDYVVRNPGQAPVKFDGCAVWDPRHPLLEAKGPGYAALVPKALKWNFFKKVREKVVSQAARQAGAAPDNRIEWHVAEPGALQFFQDVTTETKPPIVPRLTLPSW